ncbi:histidine kinase-like ATPase [Lactarius pseudohatsudake]|nr:histidine kinase-like ATPase [Lactarius pseudohatsudake]
MSTSKEALWAAGRDEAVEVNQRALIDKVLARYSGEFTVFRELLQNSDDAGANSVEIRFETQSYLFRVKQSGVDPDKSLEEDLPNLKTAVVRPPMDQFKNNGTKFRDEDWNRLKKIAEGNPDEEKIGAFGVGFYSLFSVTEEPWVTSGGQWMNFYWKDKKDQVGPSFHICDSPSLMPTRSS